jgi:hypothetical protein
MSMPIIPSNPELVRANKGAVMSDRTAAFFDALTRRGREPLLADVTGSLRFDLVEGQEVEHWLLTISHEEVRVSQEDRDADTAVRTTKTLFDQIVCGEANLYSAWVRNDLTVMGDVRLARLLQRLFPGPPGAHDPRDFTREWRQQA